MKQRLWEQERNPGQPPQAGTGLGSDFSSCYECEYRGKSVTCSEHGAGVTQELGGSEPAFLTSLCLRFLIWEMGTMVEATSQVLMRLK